MAASLSMDLRQRIVDAYECGKVSCRAVAARFGVAASTMGKLVQQAKTENSLRPRYARCDRKLSMSEEASPHTTSGPAANTVDISPHKNVSCSMEQSRNKIPICEY